MLYRVKLDVLDFSDTTKQSKTLHVQPEVSISERRAGKTNESRSQVVSSIKSRKPATCFPTVLHHAPRKNWTSFSLLLTAAKIIN